MHYKSIGTTGTRDGLSGEQRDWLEDFLIYNSANVLHHGDCVGTDVQVAALFAEKDTYIIAHPGSNVSMYRARCKVNDLVLTGCDALARNRYIVTRSNLVLAFPLTNTDALRSGTWYTIRYAKKLGVPVKIITPNGQVSHESTQRNVTRGY